MKMISVSHLWKGESLSCSTSFVSWWPVVKYLWKHRKNVLKVDVELVTDIDAYNKFEGWDQIK